MDAAFAIIPILFYLLFMGVTVFVLYLVIQAAVRNGINSSVIGKRIKEKEDKNPTNTSL